MSEVSNQPQSHTVRNTLLWAGSGAALSGGLSYWTQKNLLSDTKKQKEVKDTFEKLSKIEKPSFWEKSDLENHKIVTEIIKEGKVNGKVIATGAARSAVIWGGVYLLFKGIKSLFSGGGED